MAANLMRGSSIRSSTMSTSSRNRGVDHEEFLCAICVDYYDQPVRTSCNHLFCESCLVQALSIKPECPFCREQLANTEFKRAPEIVKKMQTKTLACETCNGKFKPIDGRVHETGCMENTKNTFSAANGAAGFTQPRMNLGLDARSNRLTFSCAYCGQKNFPREDLLSHCIANHKQAPNHKLVCTICIAYPWGDKSMVSGHLLDHLKMRHQFDYDRFVDLEETEEESLQDTMQASVYHN